MSLKRFEAGCRTGAFVVVAAVAAGSVACGSSEGDASDAGAAGNADATRPPSGEPIVAAAPDAAAPISSFDAAPDTPALRPVLFVHGINGTGTEYNVMVQRLAANGWNPSWLFAKTFPDPKWGCNGDNAKTIATWVAEILAQTGAKQIDLVAHSMGGLSSRHFMKHHGGASLVRTYVSLGSMHHGLSSPCLSPLDVCVWKELCQTGPFVADLDTAPATPGPARWVSIFSTDDGIVPVEASKLNGATNVQLTGIPHAGAGGLMEAPASVAEVEKALRAP